MFYNAHLLFIRKQTVDVHRVLLDNNLLSTVDPMSIFGIEFCNDLSWENLLEQSTV